MRALVRAVDRISHVCGMLAAVLVIVLVVLMLYDVVLRYAFNAPTSWGNDLNAFLMGGSFVLSIAYAMSTDAHVRVDLLYNERTRPRLAYVDLIGLIADCPARRGRHFLGAAGVTCRTASAPASAPARVDGTQSCGRFAP